MANTFILKKLSDESFEEKSLAELKAAAEEEQDTYYIPAFKKNNANYKVPVTDFGKGDAVGGDTTLRIFDTVAKYTKGLQYMSMFLNGEAEKIIIGQDLKVGPRKTIDNYESVPYFISTDNRANVQPLDMSTITNIDWVTWHSAAVDSYYYTDSNNNSINYWDVYNPYINLYLDTNSMTIGKLYTIKIHAQKNMRDPVKTIETSVSTRNSSAEFYYGQSKAGTSTAFTEETFPWKLSRALLPLITGTEVTGTVTLQNARGYYDNHLPEGISGSDIVIEITYGPGNSTAYCVMNTSNSHRPKVTANKVSTTGYFSTRLDGTLICKFEADSVSGNDSYWYELDVPTDKIVSVDVNTDLILPEAIDKTADQAEWKYRKVTFNPNIEYKFEADTGFRLYAPLNGPKFFWPYLLADNGSSSEAGASYLTPRFYLTINESVDSTKTTGDHFTPNTPQYESTVYMCRIDNNHVLVLGY